MSKLTLYTDLLGESVKPDGPPGNPVYWPKHLAACTNGSFHAIIRAVWVEIDKGGKSYVMALIKDHEGRSAEVPLSIVLVEGRP